MTVLFIGHIILRVLCFMFFVLLTWRILVGVRASVRAHDGAMSLLERKFASGEITEEVFRLKREILTR